MHDHDTGRSRRARRLLQRSALVLSLLGGAARADDGDAALDRKLDAVIECINDHSNWVRQSRQRYLSWIKSPERGPTGKERVVYGLYALQDLSRCRAAIDASAGVTPAVPELDPAVREWLQALLVTDAIVDEAQVYYALQTYKDDGMEAGKALHPRLIDAYAAFDGADRRLRGLVERIRDARTLRRLERLAADPGKRVPYLVERLLREADLMLRSAHGLGDDRDFDVTRMSTHVAALRVAWREFSDHRKAHPEDGREVIRMSGLVDAGFALLESATAAERRARDGFVLDEGERMLVASGAAQLVDGHPAQLLERYNDLVDIANRTRW
jgi:hypothetical protein